MVFFLHGFENLRMVSIHARDRATTTFGRAYTPPERDYPPEGWEVSNRSWFSMNPELYAVPRAGIRDQETGSKEERVFAGFFAIVTP
jgi:hypothetical protein